ncbi:hypothetical protein J633_3434 [Acinetobacter sp. 216872]|nr:hypothetical protein J633_3434 [Acinetobacter sp. 216872]PRV97230.1 hypothetical protein CSB87_1700 [Acinetobacter sp. AR_0276]
MGINNLKIWFIKKSLIFFFAIYVDIHVIFNASIQSKRHTSSKFSSS